MQIYALRHTPTGLWFCSSRKVKVTAHGITQHVKTNLSTQPKLYTKRPHLSYLGEYIYSADEASLGASLRANKGFLYNKGFPIIRADWQIVDLTPLPPVKPLASIE